MRKLFSLLAALTIFMVLIAGFGVYWISTADVNQARQDSAAAEAKSLALGISAHIALLNKTLDKMVQDPDVLTAISIGNAGLLKVTAEKLEKYIPDVLKIRLLLPDVNEPDEQNLPRMGFADLDLVRETFTKNQVPGIQGDKNVDRHLAIARGIISDGKVVGVVLASLDEAVILKNLHLAPLKNVYLELKQGNMVLDSFGQKPANEDTETQHVPVANTDWNIQYQYVDRIDWSNLSLVASIILFPVLIILLLCFLAHRWLSDTLTQDLESLMKAFKDIMTHTMHSNYPAELTELNAAIANLMQFKRVLDYGDKDSSPVDKDEVNIIVSDDDDFNLDGFFDDATDFKL